MHVVLPWSWPSHGSYLSRVSQQWRGYFTSQVYPLLVLELMALKPPFFVTVLSYQGPRLPHGVAPSTVFPTHGHRGVTPSISPLGYVFSWRCLSRAMPLVGDASLRRCLSWAMSLLGDASLGDAFAWRCLSRAMSLLGDVSLGRCLSWAMPLFGDASLRRCLSWRCLFKGFGFFKTLNITRFNNLPLFDEDKSLMLVLYLIKSEAIPAEKL